MAGDETVRFIFQLIEQTAAFSGRSGKLSTFEFPFQRRTSMRIARIFLHKGPRRVEEVSVSLGIKLDRVFPGSRFFFTAFFESDERRPIGFDRILAGSGRNQG